MTINHMTLHNTEMVDVAKRQDALKLSCNERGWSFEDAKQTISSTTIDDENAMSGSQSGAWVRLQAECKLNLITQ